MYNKLEGYMKIIQEGYTVGYHFNLSKYKTLGDLVNALRKFYPRGRIDIDDMEMTVKSNDKGPGYHNDKIIFSHYLAKNYRYSEIDVDFEGPYRLFGNIYTYLLLGVPARMEEKVKQYGADNTRKNVEKTFLLYYKSAGHKIDKKKFNKALDIMFE